MKKQEILDKGTTSMWLMTSIQVMTIIYKYSLINKGIYNKYKELYEKEYKNRIDNKKDYQD